ncbi:Serine-threonine kinase receptor-associated protein [Balamuthia mandrillaris]
MQQCTTNYIPVICGGHSRPVPFIDFVDSPDGLFLASACLDGKAMLRFGATGDWVGTLIGHKGAVWSARLNSEATLIATSSADYTAKVWSAITGDELLSFEHGKIVKTASFSPDGRLLLTGGQEKTLRIFNLEKAYSDEVRFFQGHTQSIRTCLWTSPFTFVSGGDDSVMRCWDLRTGAEVLQWSTGGSHPISSIELSHDSNYLTVAAGKSIYFLGANGFEVLKAFNTNFVANSASLRPDAKTFVAGGADFWAHLFDFETGEELDTFKGHHGPVHCVRFSPSGQFFASSSEDGTIRLWMEEKVVSGLEESQEQERAAQKKEQNDQQQSSSSSSSQSQTRGKKNHRNRSNTYQPSTSSSSPSSSSPSQQRKQQSETSSPPSSSSSTTSQEAPPPSQQPEPPQPKKEEVIGDAQTTATTTQGDASETGQAS